MAYVGSKVWTDYKGVRSLGVWFGKNSRYNRFSTEYPIPEPSKEEKYNGGMGRVIWADISKRSSSGGEVIGETKLGLSKQASRLMRSST